MQDVEEIGTAVAQRHACAVASSSPTYLDPATGNTVFTAAALAARGRCCGCGCRHCPYNHQNVSMERRAAKISAPALLHGAFEQLQGPVDVLFWSGGKDSFLASRALRRAHSSAGRLCLLTTFDSGSRTVAHQEVPIATIVAQAAHLGLPLVGVPLCSHVPCVDRVAEALRHIEAGLLQHGAGRSLPAHVSRVCTGDLHLEDIMAWRMRELGPAVESCGASLHAPLWHVPYAELLADLSASGVPCRVCAIGDGAEGRRAGGGATMGDAFDTELLERLEVGCDAFGEHGEFHTLAAVWEAAGDPLCAAVGATPRDEAAERRRDAALRRLRPLRVCSVLPSATEALCFIGGAHLLVGRSHEDNYPESIARLPVLTGQKTSFTTARDVDEQVSASLSAGASLYTLDVAMLASLRPDVILTQDLCSVCAIDLVTVERVAASLDPKPAVVSLNPETLEEVLDTLLQLGDAVGLRPQADAAHAALVRRIATVDAAVAAHYGAPPPPPPPAPAPQPVRGPSVAFIEWPDPIYVGGHWTPQLIVRAGGSHPLNQPDADGGGGGKSFPVGEEAVVSSAPELVVLSPCGLDLAATRREAGRLQASEWWRRLPAVAAGRVALVDGDAMFNRPGPRLVDALEWLASVILRQPSAAPAGFPFAWLGAPAAAEPEPAAAEAGAGVTDIEEAHACAVRQGQTSYLDPATGYSVFTQLASEQRGHCCGSGCRHCVYGHQNVPEERRARLAPPIIMRSS